MLRTKLFKAFALLVVLFSVLSAALGLRMIKTHVFEEAQTRARLDLSSAWAVYNSKLAEVETILRLVAVKDSVVQLCEQGDWSNLEIRTRLENIRANFNLDFLDLVGPDGKVMMRTSRPYAVGDYRSSEPAVHKALQGQRWTGMSVLGRAELEVEAEGLAERAYLEVVDTPQSRKSPKKEETRGMVMVSAVPIEKNRQLLGVVYGGVLVNRNFKLIDQIHSVIFKDETYYGAPKGTATIFLNDVRIVTTVRQENGNRALGTRVSKEVADRVLDNGQAWESEAFVVREKYLTAYEPIRDGNDTIIGMLYVGLLKKPFMDYEREVILRYLLLSLFLLVVALGMAFVIASRLARPIQCLVEASNRMRQGDRPSAVCVPKTYKELRTLVESFNGMAQALNEREDSLRALNRSYMDMLSFVSHELKSPIAVITNYVYLLGKGKLGPLTDKQQKAAASIEHCTGRLVEMVRHYLNLARIENGELVPSRAVLPVRADVLNPLLESLESSCAARRMQVLNEIGDEVRVDADSNMAREVFENLISNAIKYGREGGRLRLSCVSMDRWVEFRVWNEGEGIPEEKAARLFQKFSRLDNGTPARRERGTGLGLYICRQIVEAHGGSIHVTSQPGEWTQFAFTLPAVAEPAAQGPATTPPGVADQGAGRERT